MKETVEDLAKDITIFGQLYKIGLHGKVYVKRGREWALSVNYTPSDIRAALEDRFKPKRREKLT